VRIRDCRRQAAYCRAELGDTEAALASFGALLDDEVRRHGAPRSDEALELRRQIGVLLLTAQRSRDAAAILRSLQEDLLAVRGEGDPDLRDVRELLTRIRLMNGSDHS
jgi:hypothetical protein